MAYLRAPGVSEPAAAPARVRPAQSTEAAR
jgi:hypothetical protein